MFSYTVDPGNPLPLYFQVYTSLSERIKSGEFNPGDVLPAERQLVKDYGVSRITIVKALDLLERDHLIERQHGRGTFVIDGIEEAHVAPVHHSIGFLPGGMVHPYHYSVQMGIARVAFRERCLLRVIGLYDEASIADITYDVQGLIVYPKGNRGLSIFRQLHERAFPMVMVDRYYPQIDTDYVIFDEEVAAYQLTSYLIERGHRRIAFLTRHELDATSIRNRMAGYVRAMEAYNLYDEDLLWLDIYARYDPFDYENSYEALTAHLHKHLETYQPTGLVAVNHDVADRLAHDLMLINAGRARHAIANSHSHNYEIQVEIAAFGHKHPVDYSPYHVAIALQPGEDLGSRATELLIGRLAGRVSDGAQRIRVPVKIVTRETQETQVSSLIGKEVVSEDSTLRS